jgi:hypothetical protein
VALPLSALTTSTLKAPVDHFPHAAQFRPSQNDEKGVGNFKKRSLLEHPFATE